MQVPVTVPTARTHIKAGNLTLRLVIGKQPERNEPAGSDLIQPWLLVRQLLVACVGKCWKRHAGY